MLFKATLKLWAIAVSTTMGAESRGGPRADILFPKICLSFRGKCSQFYLFPKKIFDFHPSKFLMTKFFSVSLLFYENCVPFTTKHFSAFVPFHCFFIFYKIPAPCHRAGPRGRVPPDPPLIGSGRPWYNKSRPRPYLNFVIDSLLALEIKLSFQYRSVSEAY